MNNPNDKTKKDHVQPLTLDDLNVTELEQRLELAAAAAACACDKNKTKAG